ncbi:YqaJ viral recombinase family protein [Basilea psittacipulmonis]|uniref:Exonuclease n=1 Tax=Basilea psittacipulmonis DSM 24701 TaxID=1072685 RepID=A0A077DEF8_9BURK|nr:YqaJ viral recombinase family protein [Basilea psittacipulmonis]AIL33114.1 exonuclease [Basilea psittacipulmonis DSM 24701]
MALITLNCEQGSQEWLEARLGIVTATGASNIVTPSGNKSNGWVNYLSELVAETYEGAKDPVRTADMERGHELEPKARAGYEFLTEHEVKQVGGIYLDENRDVMISPDGIMPDLKKGLEIKSPRLKNHIKYILEGGVPSEYLIQVQFSLWVTGFESWDFVSYCPEYTPQTMYLHTTTRNDTLMRAFDRLVPQFLKQLNGLKRGK